MNGTNGCRQAVSCSQVGSAVLICLQSLSLFLGSSDAEEIVRLRAEQPGGKPYSLRGEIVDFTGRELTLRGHGGRDRRIPSARVEQIETVWPEARELGRAAALRGEFAEAAQQFSAANRVEKRTWARRMILAQLVVCLHAIGRDEQAGDVFLAVLRSDPDTPAFDRIPLAWFTGERVSTAKATAWGARSEEPAAVLLGASHLLTTQHRTPATAALKQLATTASDRRIVALAEAQLWRTQMGTVNERDIQKWCVRIDTMPSGIGGGPFFALAQGFDRLGRSDDAALAYLRVPILFPLDRPLAARALLAAAHATNRAGHDDEARHLLRELIQEYGESPDRTEAEQVLKSL